MKIELESFLTYLKNVKRYSALTLTSYRNDLTLFSEFCEKVEEINEWTAVTSVVVRHFEIGLMSGTLKKLRKGNSKPMKPSSVRRKLSALRSFFHYQMREGLRSDDPMENVIIPKMGRRLPVFVPDYQMEELLQEEEVQKVDFSIFRDLMLLLVAYCTGMRRSELVALKLEDLDIEGGFIKVTGKGDKQRIIPLMESLKEEIRQYLAEREIQVSGKHSFFFVTNVGNPVNEKYVYRHIKACLQAITPLSKRSPHVLRHSFATALLNNGACSEAIRKLLGHSSLAATQRYTHNSFENLKQYYNQAHPRA